MLSLARRVVLAWTRLLLPMSRSRGCSGTLNPRPSANVQTLRISLAGLPEIRFLWRKRRAFRFTRPSVRRASFVRPTQARTREDRKTTKQRPPKASEPVNECSFRDFCGIASASHRASYGSFGSCGCFDGDPCFPDSTRETLVLRHPRNKSRPRGRLRRRIGRFKRHSSFVWKGSRRRIA